MMKKVLLFLLAIAIWVLAFWLFSEYQERELYSTYFVPDMPQKQYYSSGFSTGYHLATFDTKRWYFTGMFFSSETFEPSSKIVSPHTLKFLGKDVAIEWIKTFLARSGEEYFLELGAQEINTTELVLYNHSGSDLRLCLRWRTELPLRPDRIYPISRGMRDCENIQPWTYMAINLKKISRENFHDALQVYIKPQGQTDTLTTLIVRTLK